MSKDNKNLAEHKLSNVSHKDLDAKKDSFCVQKADCDTNKGGENLQSIGEKSVKSIQKGVAATFYSTLEQYPFYVFPSEGVLKKVNAYAKKLNVNCPVDFFQKLAKRCIELGINEEAFLEYIDKNYDTPYNIAFNLPYEYLNDFGKRNNLRYECDLLSLKNVTHKTYFYDKYVSDSPDFENITKPLLQFGQKSIIGSVEASGKSTAFRNVILPIMEQTRKASNRESAIMYVAPLTGIVRQQFEYLRNEGFEMCVGSDERNSILKKNECQNASTISLDSKRIITTFAQAGILFNRYIERSITPIVYIDEVHAVIDSISFQHENHHFADIFSHEQSIVMGVSATPQYRMFQEFLGVDNIVVMKRKFVADKDKFPLSVTVSKDKDMSATTAFSKAIALARTGKQVLVINDNREENEGFANAAKRLGISADHCHSERKNIDDFHSIRLTGRLFSQILFSTTVIKEGYDIYGIDTVANLNDMSGKDYTMGRQSLRRGRDADTMSLTTYQKYSTASSKHVDYDWVKSKSVQIQQRIDQVNEALDAIEKIDFAKEFRNDVLENSFHEMQKGLGDQFSKYIRYVGGRAKVNLIAILCEANERYKSTLGHEDILNIFANDESYSISHYQNLGITETFDNSEVEEAKEEREEATKEIWNKNYKVEKSTIKGHDLIAAIIYFESNKESLKKELAYRFDYIAELEARGQHYAMPEEIWGVCDQIKETYSSTYAIKLAKRYCRTKAATANVATEDFTNELVFSETDNEFSTHLKRINHIRGKQLVSISKNNKVFMNAMTFGSDSKKIEFDTELCRRIQKLFNDNQRSKKHTSAYDFYGVYDNLANELNYSPFGTAKLATKRQKATRIALYIKPFFDIEVTKVKQFKKGKKGTGEKLQRWDVLTIDKNTLTLQPKTRVKQIIKRLKPTTYESKYNPIFVKIGNKIKFHFLNFEGKKTAYLKKKEVETSAREFDCLFM